MESTPAPAVSPPELILRNGRQQGARRPLAPITFIGSQHGCDIRLNVEAVQPVHCVIAQAQDTLNLRSLSGAEVLVNGSAAEMYSLSNGDVVQIGPFEFEVFIDVPMAQPVNTVAVFQHPLPSPEKQSSEIRELQRQLSDARANFRREKKEQQQDITNRLEELAELRDDVEKREAAVSQERTRLIKLRKRFIQRWKKHWSSERIRIDKGNHQIHQDRETLRSKQQSFATQSEQFHEYEENARQRIEQGRRQLRDAVRKSKEEHTQRQTSLDIKAREIAEHDRRIQADRAALENERIHVEQQVAQLRMEANGLEPRIANLRAVLRQLETHRRPESTQSVEALPETSTAKEPAVEERLANLERLINEVGDQRRALLEQTDRLAEAREVWREEETRLVREMEELGQSLHIWEDLLNDRESGISLEEEAIERDRTNLEQLRDRLDAWQARLEAKDVELREQSQRLEAELHQKSRQLDRREIALTDLRRRWSERRRAEVQQLRADHRRCISMRMVWSQNQNDDECFEQVLLNQQRDLAGQALALEQARQKFVVAAQNPRVAAKKLERFQRHLDRAHARRDEMLQRQWQSLHAERKEFAELFGQTSERVEQFAALEREVADRLMEAERREHRLTDREVAVAETETVFKAQRESYERECAELRNEIDRLAGLLVSARTVPLVPLARAA